MGTDVMLFTTKPLTFRVTYVLNKTYQIRVLYFTQETYYSRTNQEDKLTVLKEGSGNSDRFVRVMHNPKSHIKITIESGKPNKDSLQRYSVKTAYPSMACYADDHRSKQDCNPETCNALGDGRMGTYVVENVVTHTAKSEDDSNAIIEVKSKKNLSVVVLGVELIVLPLMP